MKYCLIGKNLSYSYSKLLHERFGFDYSLEALKEEELEGFVKGCPFDGFNITIPYKKQIIPFLDEVSKAAREIGAVNTVAVRNGKKCGYNTDYAGFLKTFERYHVGINGKNALVLGSGGASSVAVKALEDRGAKSVTVVSRSGEIDYENCYDLVDTNIIVNATPVGTNPDLDGSIIDLKRFPKLEFVFDLVYNPCKTKLLLQAEESGVKYSNGLCMLVGQALEAEKIWTGKDYSDADLKNGISFLKRMTTNIALIGMPSSGKSTIGKVLAKRLGKELYDTDKIVLKNTGKTAEEIINERGEKAFRDEEEIAVKEALLHGGAIVALGGGAVLREKSRQYLKQTAFTVYVKRPLELLSSKGRPLSQERGVEALYNERAHIYEGAGDFTVMNDKTVGRAAQEIIEAYENFSYKRT